MVQIQLKKGIGIVIASYEEVIGLYTVHFVYTILPPSYSDRRSLSTSLFPRLCPPLLCLCLHPTSARPST